MKKIVLFLLALSLLPLFAAACSKEAEVVDVLEVVDVTGAQSAPQQADAPAAGGTAANGGKAEVSVLDTVAFLFEGTEGLTLYGAAVYENTGDHPLCIPSASFRFSVAGQEIERVFSPILFEYDVVAPGEKGYITLWTTEGVEALQAGDAVTLTAAVTPEKATNARIELALDNLYLADNYPRFTTLSGTVQNKSGTECALNMLYAAFYGEDGDLLGVWNFTRNALLEPGEAKDFVVHMKELPIPDLAAACASVEATGFGF